MKYDEIICNDNLRGLIKEYIRRWGVRQGVMRVARRLETTQAEIHRARPFILGC